ncbi:MAG: radical SAM protein [Desulfobacterales bacterium]|nr:radical SAM protein [Desulfobacterales bacterium]
MKDKTVSFSKHAKNVFFHILTNCNLKCIHCYINPDQHGRKTLPLSTIELWLKEFISSNDETNLVILGGEPTLHPELPSIIKTARKIGYSSITIDTNGYLFNDFLSKIEPELVDYISFSLDGATKKINDLIRGDGSYDTCIAGVKKAVLKGFATSLIYTVNKLNIHEIKAVVPLLKDIGIKRFFIQVVGIRGKSFEKMQKNLQVFWEEWLDIIPDAASLATSEGLIAVYPKVYLKKDEPFECAGIAADNYFIFPNGRVYRCPICEDYPINSLEFNSEHKLIKTSKINEQDLFKLNIPEGCVMNKIIQPNNIPYDENGIPKLKIACCLLKQSFISPG